MWRWMRTARKPRAPLKSPARTRPSAASRKWASSRPKSLRRRNPRKKPAAKKTKAAPRAGGGRKRGALDIQIKIPGLSGRVKPKVLTTFTRQLATLVDAGLPLLRGLRVLEKQERNGTLRDILGQLALAIEGGSTFSEALAQHPKVFNRLFVNMVKAGELGGVLEVVLRRLAEFSKRRRRSRARSRPPCFIPWPCSSWPWASWSCC